MPTKLMTSVSKQNGIVGYSRVRLPSVTDYGARIDQQASHLRRLEQARLAEEYEREERQRRAAEAVQTRRVRRRPATANPLLGLLGALLGRPDGYLTARPTGGLFG